MLTKLKIHSIKIIHGDVFLHRFEYNAFLEKWQDKCGLGVMLTTEEVENMVIKINNDNKNVKIILE